MMSCRVAALGFIVCLLCHAATGAAIAPTHRRLLSIQLSQTTPQPLTKTDASRATDGASTTAAVNGKVGQALGSTYAGGASSKARITSRQANANAAAAAAAAQSTSLPAGVGGATINSKVVAKLGKSWGPKTRVVRQTAQATHAAAPAASHGAPTVTARPASTVPWQRVFEPTN